jgi:hypothetical protein
MAKSSSLPYFQRKNNISMFSARPELRRQQNFEVALKLLEAIRGPFFGGR